MAKAKPDPREGREIILEAFFASGGMKSFVNWIRTHRASFYTSILPKLLPLVAQETKVTVNVNDSNKTIEKLLDAFDRQHFALEQQRTIATSYTDVTPEPAGDFPTTGKSKPAEASGHPESSADNVIKPEQFRRAPAHVGSPDWGNVHLDRTPTSTPPAPERSTTQKYYDWADSGGLGMWSPPPGWS